MLILTLIDINRGRSASSSKNSFRESSVLSRVSLVAYYECMEVMNNLLGNDAQDLIDSSQLSYTSDKGEVEGGKVVNKANDKSS